MGVLHARMQVGVRGGRNIVQRSTRLVRKHVHLPTYTERTHQGGSNDTIRMEIGRGLGELPRVA